VQSHGPAPGDLIVTDIDGSGPITTVPFAGLPETPGSNRADVWFCDEDPDDGTLSVYVYQEPLFPVMEPVRVFVVRLTSPADTAPEIRVVTIYAPPRGEMVCQRVGWYRAEDGGVRVILFVSGMRGGMLEPGTLRVVDMSTGVELRILPGVTQDPRYAARRLIAVVVVVLKPPMLVFMLNHGLTSSTGASNLRYWPFCIWSDLITDAAFRLAWELHKMGDPSRQYVRVHLPDAQDPDVFFDPETGEVSKVSPVCWHTASRQHHARTVLEYGP
jgi:hypothetical protein